MKPGPADFETKILDAAIDFFHEYEWIYNAYLDNMEAMPQLAQEARFKLWDNTAKYLKKFGTTASSVSLLTGMTRAELDELGGFSDS